MRPIAVGDILETEVLAFEMDARQALVNFQTNEYWWTETATFYDFEKDDCPWSLWAVVAQKEDLFLIVPWTANDKSTLCDNNHPDHFTLPCPVKVKAVWEDWSLAIKGYGIDNTPHEIFALAGYSQWRTAAELNALLEWRMRVLVEGEAKKVAKEINNFVCVG